MWIGHRVGFAVGYGIVRRHGSIPAPVLTAPLSHRVPSSHSHGTEVGAEQPAATCLDRQGFVVYNHARDARCARPCATARGIRLPSLNTSMAHHETPGRAVRNPGVLIQAGRTRALSPIRSWKI